MPDNCIPTFDGAYDFDLAGNPLVTGFPSQQAAVTDLAGFEAGCQLGTTTSGSGAALSSQLGELPIITTTTRTMLIAYVYFRSTYQIFWATRDHMLRVELIRSGVVFFAQTYSIRLAGVPDVNFPIMSVIPYCRIPCVPMIRIPPGSVVNGQLTYSYGAGSAGGTVPYMYIGVGGFHTADAILAARLGALPVGSNAPLTLL
jgi:hypothetical protein